MGAWNVISQCPFVIIMCQRWRMSFYLLHMKCMHMVGTVLEEEKFWNPNQPSTYLILYARKWPKPQILWHMLVSGYVAGLMSGLSIWLCCLFFAPNQFLNCLLIPNDGRQYDFHHILSLTTSSMCILKMLLAMHQVYYVPLSWCCLWFVGQSCKLFTQWCTYLVLLD